MGNAHEKRIFFNIMLESKWHGISSGCGWMRRPPVNVLNEAVADS
jgi:hypothetical protein